MTPIEYRVIKSLQSHLQGIRSPDGYFYTVQEVAVKLDPDHKVEQLIPGADEPIGPPRPVIVLDISISPTYSYLERHDRITMDLPFIVNIIHDTDPTDDDSKLRTYLQLAADVERAIAEAGNHEGLASDTLITGRTMRLVDGQQIWALIAGRVHLHRGFGRPNG